MQKRAPAFTKNETRQSKVNTRNTVSEFTTDVVTVSSLQRHIEDWLYDCQFQQQSTNTIEFRLQMGKKLIWFLEQRDHSRCSLAELRQFLAYVADGYKEPNGRWGNPKVAANLKPVRPATIHRYYRELRTLFNWLVREELLSESPVERITPPKLKAEQVQPFTQEQIETLRRAARRSFHPRRDEAIVLLLLDTGLRASELCGLRMSDMDMQGRHCSVIGKGNKRRTIYFGRTAGKALWQYLREEPREEDSPIFVSDRGKRAGEPLQRSGLLQLIKRLGRAAHVQDARCSPHTFRHTFAIEFLRNGGNVFSLQQILGHTSLHMTNRYVALAQADIENQHRQFSPADRLRS